MLRGQDVVVLLKLLGSPRVAPVRELADQLGFDVAGTHRALRRLSGAGLYSSERQRVFRGPTEEFLVHAVKFFFPAQWGSEARGVPTAWAAKPLKDELADSHELPPVWPYYEGEVRGLALKPLHPMVVEAAQEDPDLAQRLALVDALRSGDSPRVNRLAARLLKEGIDS